VHPNGDDTNDQSGSDGAPSRAFAPLPLDGLRVEWSAIGGGGESLLLRFENEGWTAEGSVDTGEQGRGFQYVMRLSATWHLQQMLLFRDLDEPDLWLANDGRGKWGEMNGAVRRELGGCEDVDLLLSPFTATMGVRRLDLTVGQVRDVESATVDTETLAIERVRLRYERLDTELWNVTRLDVYDDLYPASTTTSGSLATEFAVDEFGLALDLPGRFSRLRRSPAATP